MIAERVIAVIARELSIAPHRVTGAARFRDELAADSLDLVSITMALEEAFEVEISDDEADACPTVASAIDMLRAKLLQPVF